jgi:hypothetical protein
MPRTGDGVYMLYAVTLNAADIRTADVYLSRF